MNYKKYEGQASVYRFFKKNKKNTQVEIMLSNLRIWKKSKKSSISRQTSVCRLSGRFKRVINLVGFNRHEARCMLNTRGVPFIRKLTW